MFDEVKEYEVEAYTKKVCQFFFGHPVYVLVCLYAN